MEENVVLWDVVLPNRKQHAAASQQENNTTARADSIRLTAGPEERSDVTSDLRLSFCGGWPLVFDKNAILTARHGEGQFSYGINAVLTGQDRTCGCRSPVETKTHGAKAMIDRIRWGTFPATGMLSAVTSMYYQPE
jgi:hypothetical protein